MHSHYKKGQFCHLHNYTYLLLLMDTIKCQKPLKFSVTNNVSFGSKQLFVHFHFAALIDTKNRLSLSAMTIDWDGPNASVPKQNQSALPWLFKP